VAKYDLRVPQRRTASLPPNLTLKDPLHRLKRSLGPIKKNCGLCSQIAAFHREAKSHPQLSDMDRTKIDGPDRVDRDGTPFFKLSEPLRRTP
jgi:hypothetical protein